MVVRLNSWLGILAAISTAVLLPNVAIAQTDTANETDDETRPVLEVVDDVLFNQAGDFYSNRGFGSSIALIFGFPFPENAIISDAEDFNALYRDLMALQTVTDQVLEGEDLPTPFNESLANASSLEPVFPPTPPAPALIPPPAPTVRPAPPAAPTPQQRTGPVRALF